MAAQAMAVSAPESRLGTILHVQWALAIACAYLVLFGQESGDAQGLGPLVVVGFLATNLVVGRLRPEVVEAPMFGPALAGVDAALIATSLFVAGQLSIELVLLCLGVLVLAIAGLRTGPIALATLGMTAVYLIIVWLTDRDSLWRTSVLLRVPLLFTAAIVYAWLVEVGTRRTGEGAEAQPARATNQLLDDLAAQWEAIQRCQDAVRSGSPADAETALRDVAAQNQTMRMHCAATQR